MARLGVVLSIGKLTAGGRGARYYTQAVAQGREDYYAGSGEAPGKWIGSGWGLDEGDREVTESELRTLLQGRHPVSGAPVRRGIVRAAMGFDLTFSAPKSASILFGVGEHDTSSAVRDAHDVAVREALGYLERNACRTRRGRAGKRSIAGEGFLAASFRHRTSRAGDPQLHTHVVIANGVRGSDGRWGSLDARLLYRHAKTAGYLYQAALRAEMTDRLGVDWTPVTKGSAELLGVPRGLIHHFSQRREEITLQLARRGLRSRAAAQVAALDTRRRKQYGVPVDRLREDWRARAGEHGFGEHQLTDVLERAEEFDPVELELGRAAAEMAGERGVTREASTFDRRAVIQAWAQSHRRGAHPLRVEELASDWLGRDDVVELEHGVNGQGEAVYSTAELLQIEQSLIATAECRQNTGVARGSRKAVDEAVATRPSIDPEQVDLVDRLVTSGDGVQVVRSAAGTGKTFALDAAREAWQREGIWVTGCAVSARAAAELQQSAAIESTTIRRLQLDIRRGYGLREGNVLVVDEAGMVGTRDLAELAEHAAAVGAKLVLVGDDRQLPEIDAGGAFRGLADRIGALELRDVRRQAEPWDRQALLELRDGSVRSWAETYRSHGRLVAGPNAEVTRDALVAAWWRDLEQDPAKEVVMVALRRNDVADFNQRAREQMKTAGALGREEVVAGTRAFATGDRVALTTNDRILDVRNGERGDVTAIDVTARSVRVRVAEREVELPARYLDAGSVDHGYAMTAHRLQGATVDRTHVLGSDELYREWGYTALSRHRDAAHFYITTTETQQPLPGLEEHDALDDTLASLHRENAKSLASDLTIDANPQTDLADHGELLNSLPVELRQLPQLAQEHIHATTELSRAHRRLDATNAELAETGRFSRNRRAGLEHRAAAQHAAVDTWSSTAASLEAALASRAPDLDQWALANRAQLDSLTARGGLATNDPLDIVQHLQNRRVAELPPEPRVAEPARADHALDLGP